MTEALERPDYKAVLRENRVSLRDFSFPKAMREIVRTDNAFWLKDEEILALIQERFPDQPHPSLRTIQTWRLDAKDAYDKERLRIVSETLWRSANRIVPDAIAGMYDAFCDAHAQLQEARKRGDDAGRYRAQRNVGDLGTRLLAEFRGGPAEGASAVSPELIEAAAVRQLIERGVCKDEAEARAHFLLLSESVGKAMPAEGGE